jgi:catabolite regulation protein CreA
MLSLFVTLLLAGAAWAGRDKIGEFQASGFLFKDTVEVNALDDPEGVTGLLRNHHVWIDFCY